MNGEPAVDTGMAVAAGTIVKIKIADIKRDIKAQPRINISNDLIEQYAEAIKAGAHFPPVVVFSNAEEGAHLADGWHRTAAHELVGDAEIEAELHPGGLRDAILYSVSANVAHGLRRTDEDKRRAVKRLLEDKEWSQWSDRAIARLADVSHTFVANLRAGEQPAERKVQRGKRTYKMKTKEKKPAKQKAENVSPGEGDVYIRSGVPHVFKDGAWVQQEAKPEGVALYPVVAPTKEDARAVAAELSKVEPAMLVATIVGVVHETYPSLPSPEGAAQLLKSRGIEVSPQRITAIARWFEGIAFAVDGR